MAEANDPAGPENQWPAVEAEPASDEFCAPSGARFVAFRIMFKYLHV